MTGRSTARDAPADRIRRFAESLSLELSTRQIDTLLAFAALVERSSRALSLVSRGDVGRLLERHVFDSLAAAPLLSGSPVADLGSGAGFPGIPLAVASPDVRVHLIERNLKKSRFISRAVTELGIDNALVTARDSRHYNPDPAIACVVSRGVATPEVIWRQCRHWFADGHPGRLVLLSGPSTQPAVVETALHRLDERLSVQCVRPVSLPGIGHTHQLVVVDVGVCG